MPKTTSVVTPIDVAALYPGPKPHSMRTVILIVILCLAASAFAAYVALRSPDNPGYLNPTTLERDLKVTAESTIPGTHVKSLTCLRQGKTTTFTCGVVTNNDNGVLTVQVSGTGDHYLVTNAQ